MEYGGMYYHCDTGTPAVQLPEDAGQTHRHDSCLSVIYDTLMKYKSDDTINVTPLKSFLPTLVMCVVRNALREMILEGTELHIMDLGQ